MSPSRDAAPACGHLNLGAGDVEALRLVVRTFARAMDALDAADFAELPLEADLDPGRSPRVIATGQELE